MAGQHATPELRRLDAEHRRLARQAALLSGRLRRTRPASARQDLERALQAVEIEQRKLRTAEQAAILRFYRAGERSDRQFAADMRRLRSSSRALPAAPSSFAGSVFAPFHIRTGIPPWVLGVIAVLALLAATGRSAGQSDWVGLASLVIALLALLGTGVQVVLGLLDYRQRRSPTGQAPPPGHGPSGDEAGPLSAETGPTPRRGNAPGGTPRSRQRDPTRIVAGRRGRRRRCERSPTPSPVTPTSSS